MENVIITGATSMMGVALVKECIRWGTGVTAVVRPRSKNLYRLPQDDLVRVVECESAELDQLAGGLKGTKFDCFYHFAWDGTARGQRDNVFIHEKNIREALMAVRAADDLRCGAFVGAGSQAEYGRVSDIIRPETPANPEYAYGIAKLAAGRLCGQYCEQAGLRFVWGRIFSVYGEFDHDDTLVSYLIRTLLNGGEAELTLCEQEWDYLYCADAARAFYLLGEKGNGVYCVGSGEVHPLAEYVQTIRELIGADADMVRLGARPYAEKQVMKLGADITKLKRDTGFEARTGFRAGALNMIEWCKEEMKR